MYSQFKHKKKHLLSMGSKYDGQEHWYFVWINMHQYYQTRLKVQNSKSDVQEKMEGIEEKTAKFAKVLKFWSS